nr:MAG TPA: hypothetical protein [Caudoviricetes sp.]
MRGNRNALIRPALELHRSATEPLRRDLNC